MEPRTGVRRCSGRTSAAVCWFWPSLPGFARNGASQGSTWQLTATLCTVDGGSNILWPVRATCGSLIRCLWPVWTRRGTHVLQTGACHLTVKKKLENGGRVPARSSELRATRRRGPTLDEQGLGGDGACGRELCAAGRRLRAGGRGPRAGVRRRQGGGRCRNALRLCKRETVITNERPELTIRGNSSTNENLAHLASR